MTGLSRYRIGKALIHLPVCHIALLLCGICAYAAEPGSYPPEVAAWTDAEKEAQRAAGKVLQQNLNEAIRNRTERFDAPEGVYRFRAEIGEARKVHFQILDAHNMVLDFHGSTFYFEEQQRGFSIYKCSDLTIRNLNIDWDPLPFAQGVVTGLDPEHATLDFRPDPGYAVPAKLRGEGARGRGLLFDQQGRVKADQEGFVVIPVATLDDGSTRFRVGIFYSRPFAESGFAVGDRIAVWVRAGRNYLPEVCGRIVSENINLWASGFVAVCGNVGEGPLVFRNVRIEPRPGTNRLLGGNADGFNVRGMGKGPILENCVVDSIADDAVNFQGIYYRVFEVRSPTELVTQGFPKYGDEQPILRFMTADTSHRALGAIRVANLTRTPYQIPDTWKPLGWHANQGFKPGQQTEASVITLREPLPAADGQIIFSSEGALCTGAEIRNCSFRNIFSRGIRLQSSHAVIENNRIERTTGAGLTLAGHPSFWGEADNAHDVQVRGNTFIENAIADPTPARAAIVIQTPGDKAQADLISGISIVDNTIRDSGGSAIYLDGCRNVTISQNKITGWGQLRSRPRPGTDKPERYGLAILNKNAIDPTITENKLEAPGPHGLAEPMITFLQSGWSVEEAIEHGRELGANHIWIGDAENAGCEKLKAAGLTPVMLTNPAGRGGAPRQPEEWVYGYVKTPWHEKGTGDLVIDLLAIHDRDRLRLCPEVDTRLAVRLQARSSLAAVEPGAWTADLQSGRVTVHGGEAGEQYRAVFLVRFMTVGHWTLARNGKSRYTDGYVPSVRARHLGAVKALLERLPSADVVRPTSLLFFFLHLPGRHPVTGKPTSLANSSVGYWLGMSPARMKRFEERFGVPFDPFWITDICYGDAGFISSQGYRDWMHLIRDDVGEYAKELNDVYKTHNKRIRWFWGDGWIGMEPYLGDVDRAGFDEVVKSMDAKESTVRQIMDFESSAKRIARFPWVGLTPASDDAALQSFRTDVAQNWRWMKREMLFACPHGLTFGGSVSDAFARGGREDLIRVARDFRIVHRYTCERRVFTHDLTVYVLNTWGRMRAWQKPVHCMAQQMLQHPLVDWPVRIKWLSFDDVIAAGVPEDADVLIVGGHPGTSFAGGRYWQDESLCGAVRTFVRSGGGLLALGGATVTEGQFALEDVLGVRYDGPSCELARRELWNRNRRVDAGYYDNEAVERFGDLPRVKVSFVADAVPRDIATRISRNEYNLFCDSWVTPVDATRIAAGPETKEGTGIFLRQFGEGRVAYVGGYDWLQRFYKVLVFHVAGRLADLDRLDADNAQISTYFYAEPSLLIAYNSSASLQTTRVRLDPALAGLADDADVRMDALEDPTASRVVAAGALRRGIEVTLDSGQARYWRLTARPR